MNWMHPYSYITFHLTITSPLTSDFTVFFFRCLKLGYLDGPTKQIKYKVNGIEASVYNVIAYQSSNSTHEYLSITF